MFPFFCHKNTYLEQVALQPNPLNAITDDIYKIGLLNNWHPSAFRLTISPYQPYNENDTKIPGRRIYNRFSGQIELLKQSTQHSAIVATANNIKTITPIYLIIITKHSFRFGDTTPQLLCSRFIVPIAAVSKSAYLETQGALFASLYFVNSSIKFDHIARVITSLLL